MTTLENQILEVIQSNEEAIVKLEKGIEADFEYAFRWGKHADLFEHKLIVKKLKYLLEFIDDPAFITILKNHIDFTTESLLRGGYTERSTNVYSNLGYAIEKEVDAKLLRYYKHWYKQITREDKKTPLK